MGFWDMEFQMLWEQKFDYEKDEKDEKLIKYLATHDHWSPLDIAVCSFILRHQYSLQDN